jgi:anti-sigma factor RsiW
MNECRRTADRLAAYTDRSLTPAEHEEVQRHLERCPPCRDEASQQTGGHAVLRAKADELRGQLPPGLRSRCEALAREHARGAAGRPWTARLVPAVATAALVAFTTAAIVYLATVRSDALLAAQLTADHSFCFRTHVPSGAPPLDAAQVQARLAQDYGWTVHVPPSSPGDDVELVHARACLYGEGRVPHLLYRAGDDELSLYVLQGAARQPAQVATFGHRSRIWTRGETTFVIVSSEADDVSAAEQYLMREAR